jgi:DNA-binding Lrp family transcriptional regulator
MPRAMTSDLQVATPTDPINAEILTFSEDQIRGFHEDPLGEIARLSGVEVNTVINRIRAMLHAGTIRRVRQTLMSINLAEGGLVAWVVPERDLPSAFEWMFREDPFSGHIVMRSTEPNTRGSEYRLWTTLKVPSGYSLEKHCSYLMKRTGATAYRVMPAKRVFALGVGHVRRKNLRPGSKADVPAEPRDTEQVELSELEWSVLTPLKREFGPEEIVREIWAPRAAEAGVSLDEFYRVARELDRRGVIGRFSTFLEHHKLLSDGERVSGFNGLFHWAVPPGREIEAGKEIARHQIMTHCYWREGGPEFGNANIMGVIHGTGREMVFAHKKAIDDHLASIGIPLLYTNVFWSTRSEIKPSEISPVEYRRWCVSQGLDPEWMRE